MKRTIQFMPKESTFIFNLAKFFMFIVEKKRIQRMKRAGKDEPTMETYETLVS